MYASQKVQGSFSSLRRRETHFRHPQDHQRLSALTGSINIIQNTINTVYEVEHQKTVNTKLGKQTFWFSEVIKEFHHYCQEKRLEDTKNWEIGLHCIPKAHQSILQNPMVKK